MPSLENWGSGLKNSSKCLHILHTKCVRAHTHTLSLALSLSLLLSLPLVLSHTQGIGFTTISPSEYNVIPSSAISRPLETSPYHWLLWGSSIRHKKKRKRFHDLTLLREGQTVGCLVTQTGELHYFVDGKHVGRGWSGLPVDKPLWGIIDVYGKCSKIKAHILSDGMYVYTYCIAVLHMYTYRIAVSLHDRCSTCRYVRICMYVHKHTHVCIYHTHIHMYHTCICSIIL